MFDVMMSIDSNPYTYVKNGVTCK